MCAGATLRLLLPPGHYSDLPRSWQDEELPKSVLAYYRLMTAWMLRMASRVAATCLGPVHS